MTTEQSLLRAVLADPASDDSRLIYADWLDERGGTGDAVRAKYIRWQLAPDTPPRNAPLSVLATLDLLTGLQPHAYGYNTAPQKGESHVGYANGTEFLFRRGLLDEVRCPLAWFLARARDLFAAHPITVVVLTDREPARNWNPAYPPAQNPHPQAWSGWSRENLAPTIRAGHILPAKLWDALPAGDYMNPHPPIQAVWERYPTDDAAIAALSAACVSFGRSLVGLPPLE